jgi:hypothetical protein
MKTYLNVSFSQSRYAKELGARYDMNRALWYVPDGLDLWLFQSWLDKGVEQWMKKNGPRIKPVLRKGRRR